MVAANDAIGGQKDQTRVHRVEDGDPPVGRDRQGFRSAGEPLGRLHETHLPGSVAPGQGDQRPSGRRLDRGRLGRVARARRRQVLQEGFRRARRYRGRLRRGHGRVRRRPAGRTPARRARTRAGSSRPNAVASAISGGAPTRAHEAASRRPPGPAFAAAARAPRDALRVTSPRTSFSDHGLLLVLVIHDGSRLGGPANGRPMRPKAGPGAPARPGSQLG